MPGLIKIGRSSRGATSRAKEMHTTGVPSPFHVEFEILVDFHEDVERAAHEALDRFRVSDSREFFKCEPWDGEQAILDSYVGSFGAHIIDDASHCAVEAVGKFSQELEESHFTVAPSFRFLDSGAVAKAVGKYKEWLSRRLSEVRDA